MSEDEGLLFADEVYAIIGAAIEVHREKGIGFLEPVYHECMEVECGLRNIPFLSYQPMALDYKGRSLKKTYELDMLCYGKIIVEFKVAKKLVDEHVAQLLNYLRAANLRVGLLINFGSTGRLEWKRIVL